MSWREVARTADGLVVRVDDVDGSVDITDGKVTFQLRPEGVGEFAALTVRMDARPPVMTILPTSGNSVLIRPLVKGM